MSEAFICKKKRRKRTNKETERGGGTAYLFMEGVKYTSVKQREIKLQSKEEKRD